MPGDTDTMCVSADPVSGGPDGVSTRGDPVPACDHGVSGGPDGVPDRGDPMPDFADEMSGD